MKLDKYGLVVHEDGDGGDSCADTFRYLYAQHINGMLDIELFSAARLHLLSHQYPGIGVRHPEQWNDPCDWSRDQQTPAVILLHATGSFTELREIYERHKRRGWRYQNLDWATLEHRNYYNPELKRRNLYGDIFMLLGSIILVIRSWISDKELNQDINHQVALIQIARHGHSGWSLLARNLYRTFRRNGAFYPWEKFHAKDNPEIAKEYESPILVYIIGNKEGI